MESSWKFGGTPMGTYTADGSFSPRAPDGQPSQIVTCTADGNTYTADGHIHRRWGVPLPSGSGECQGLSRFKIVADVARDVETHFAPKLHAHDRQCVSGLSGSQRVQISLGKDCVKHSKQ